MVQVLRVHLLSLMPFDKCLLYAFRNLGDSQNFSQITFHMRRFFIHKWRIFIVLGSSLFREIWYLSEFSFTLLFENHFMRVAPIPPGLFIISFVLSLTTNGVPSSALPVKHVLFIIKNMSHMKILNKGGPRIEPCGTPDIVFFPCAIEGVHLCSLLCVS